MKRLTLIAVMASLLSACADSRATALDPVLPVGLTRLGDIEELRSAFNDDIGRPRLILLVSPT